MIGEDGFARLVGNFYRRVRTDPVLGPLYPQDDFDNAEVRLRDFLIQRFGGPNRYSESRGHPRLRMRHAPFPVDQAARDRWMQLMDSALAETAVPPEVARFMQKYFSDTGTFLMNRPGA